MFKKVHLIFSLLDLYISLKIKYEKAIRPRKQSHKTKPKEYSLKKIIIFLLHMPKSYNFDIFPGQKILMGDFMALIFLILKMGY